MSIPRSISRVHTKLNKSVAIGASSETIPNFAMHKGIIAMFANTEIAMLSSARNNICFIRVFGRYGAKKFKQAIMPNIERNDNWSDISNTAYGSNRTMMLTEIVKEVKISVL